MRASPVWMTGVSNDVVRLVISGAGGFSGPKMGLPLGAVFMMKFCHVDFS